MSSPIDLSQLPAPDVVEELDYEDILAERKARLIELTPEDERADVAATLELESEPVTKLLQENAYREMTWRQRVNEAARATMLPYASDTDLDNRAADTNTQRLMIDPGDPNATPPVDPTYERDNALRLRTQEAWEGLAPGTAPGYEYTARSADGRVRDVRCLSPEPADIRLVVLSHEGDGTASPELLDIVDTAVHTEEGHIMGDRVMPVSAEIIDYRIDARLQLYDDASPSKDLVLDEARRRLDAFVTMLHRHGRPLGVSLYTDAITGVLHVPGVMHVDLLSPADHLLIGPHQSLRCTGSQIALGGTDE
ncbi:baseplate assembly protein [Chromohalobacter sp.]|uniref:baseplate assembly protein n=1 Tax=Chromohalobacter sp. TaxID=50740 RepID=UPI003242ACE9